jgi:hypothetical protein
MSDIKRFNVVLDRIGEAIVEVENDDGDLMYYTDHLAEVERLKEIIKVKDKLIDDASKNAQALVKALDEATTHNLAGGFGEQEFTERDYSRLTPASIALCEKLFGGGK